MIDKGPVLLDIGDGIARMRLNRPDAANGMSAELLSALCDAIMVAIRLGGCMCEVAHTPPKQIGRSFPPRH